MSGKWGNSKRENADTRSPQVARKRRCETCNGQTPHRRTPYGESGDWTCISCQTTVTEDEPDDE